MMLTGRIRWSGGIAKRGSRGLAMPALAGRE
jgi:hypothetical protein